MMAPMMKPLEQAISIAVIAHSGQRDRAGQPYILHPLRVMLAVQRLGSEAMIAGVLHDVLEDTDFSFAMLRHLGVPPTPLAWVLRLTRTPEEGYEGYVQRLIRERDPWLLKIKLADLQDNLDPGRLHALSPSQAHGLADRYQVAKAQIEQALAEPTMDRVPGQR